MRLKNYVTEKYITILDGVWPEALNISDTPDQARDHIVQDFAKSIQIKKSHNIPFEMRIICGLVPLTKNGLSTLQKALANMPVNQDRYDSLVVDLAADIMDEDHEFCLYDDQTINDFCKSLHIQPGDFDPDRYQKEFGDFVKDYLKMIEHI